MLIQSLLDTDLYKFTMMQAVLHQFPAAQVEYRFQCRTAGIDLRPLRAELEAQIHHLCSLRFSEEELAYLSSLRYIKQDFVEFLRLFQLQERFITLDEQDERLELRIQGPWLYTILFEVPLLAIISELYHRHHHGDDPLEQARERLQAKIDWLKQRDDLDGFAFADFGTRRRFSRDWQSEVLQTLQSELPAQLRGTSNVALARQFNLVPIGTMAHEFIQACQALGPRLMDAQRFAFETWAREYRGDLGIALSDTYSLQAFLNDFDLYFCKLFDGARQDSGDPFAWAEAVINHYRQQRVDPATKTLVFSDNLTIEKAMAIYRQFHQQIKIAFGIGTHLTNDTGNPPINIVIKMTACNGQPVAKLSDSPGKTMCTDDTYLAWLRQAYRIDS
ncbi:MAG: nicotinate phosphoribosyltransferase [Wenzhouxiangellaceae bacterium]